MRTYPRNRWSISSPARLVAAFFLAAQCVLAQSAPFDHTAWDALLKKHVLALRQGQASAVDYAGMAADSAPLARYLASLARVTEAEFDQWDRPSQLAFLINAYNAATVSLVLTRYPALASIKDTGSLFQSPWKKAFIPLLGKVRSLDDIEHGLIRGSGRYQEPRVHFAANCASIGCPALRPEAYVGARLDAQLEQATRAFLQDRTRNRFDGLALRVSPIFKWYRADFEAGWRGAASLAQFFVLYRDALGLDAAQAGRLASADIGIAFLDYDWRLNAQPARH